MSQESIELFDSPSSSDFMSQESIELFDSPSSSQEVELLKSPSSQELAQEITESQVANQKLLDFSQQPTTLILPEDRNMAFQQAQDLPLPPTTPSELWTGEEKIVLRDNRAYYQKMIELVDKAEKEGPQKLPKQPKKSLLHLFKEKEGKKKSRKEMTDKELHDYLVANQADVNSRISREFFSENLFLKTCNEEEILISLQKGVKNVKKQDAQTMMIYIQFGHFLNLCKKWFDKEREEGRIVQNWAQWLKEKCDYSDDHARKLRALAKVLYGYPQFFTVGLPVRYIFSKLKQISSMLQVSEFREFWIKPLTLPTTHDLQASQ